MHRDQLIRLLVGDDDAVAACRRAVANGAVVRVWDGCTPASQLAGIYARRLRHVQRRGVSELGFADAVRALRAYGESATLIGAVDVHDPPYHFQLFLNESATKLITCLGVDQHWKHFDEADCSQA